MSTNPLDAESANPLAGGPTARPDRTLTVREVTAYVKRLFDRDELLTDVIVRGEISNLTVASSGHIYFTLKDEASQLSAVCFRGAAAGLKFRPQDGDRVIAGGSVTVYEKGGRYQLMVRFMRPDGAGDLAAALEVLRAKLEAEGLFDPSRKRSWPRFPRAIALCTSPTGAAVQDMISIIGRRYPLARVIVIPAVVQGEEAAGSIVRALSVANALPEVDVIITGRGGGSLEDLWAFNEEPVARAIFASACPVISAVGHETDFTIADFVADARAATPSMAAEMVTPDQTELLAALEGTGRHAIALLRGRLTASRGRLERLVAHPLLQRPEALLEQRQQRLDELAQAAALGMDRLLQRLTHRLERASVAALALSPTAVLQRGYAICRLPDGTVVRRVDEVAAGDDLRVTLSDGDIAARVAGAPAGG